MSSSMVDLKALGSGLTRLWVYTTLHTVYSSTTTICEETKEVVEMELGHDDQRIGRANNVTMHSVIEELKKVGQLATPMIVGSIFQYLVQVIGIMMVGHLGELPLSSVAIAISVANVTGFSVLVGLCGGLDTLCGQAYGAKQYEKLGTYTYSGIITLIPTCIPISLIWFFMDKLLILVGQDPLISIEARKFCLWLIPGLVAAAIYNPLIRFLQCQSSVLPLLVNFMVILVLNTFTCWTLIYKMKYGIQAVAFSISLYNWLNVVLISLYIRFSSACEKTRPRFSKEVFRNVWPFLCFGVPSALMVCLKWWAFEFVTLIAGRLPNPQLEASVLIICLTMSTLHSMIPIGLGVAVGIRVANELGAGNPDAARLSAWVVTCVGIIESSIASLILFGCRYVVGYAYSHSKEVVSYVAVLIPILCPAIVTDALQMVLSGVARGSGWQKSVAYVNLGAFYLVGVPVAVLLGFRAHLKAKGLWVGILVGSVLQSVLLIIIAALTNWKKQAIWAMTRSC